MPLVPQQAQQPGADARRPHVTVVSSQQRPRRGGDPRPKGWREGIVTATGDAGIVGLDERRTIGACQRDRERHGLAGLQLQPPLPMQRLVVALGPRGIEGSVEGILPVRERTFGRGLRLAWRGEAAQGGEIGEERRGGGDVTPSG